MASGQRGDRRAGMRLGQCKVSGRVKWGVVPIGILMSDRNEQGFSGRGLHGHPARFLWSTPPD